ncbi:MAG: SCO family protein [Azospira sp.]|nr:SCO family protein [Azospira sp.]
MKRILRTLSFTLTCAALPVTAGAADAGEAAVARLGELNGQALACRQMEASTKARNAVIALAPKTREIGELFETATNRVFLSQPSCPEGGRLTTEVGAAVLQLRLAYPSSRHTEFEVPPASEIVTRYLLQDHDGRTVTDQDFRGRFQLLTFGYTSCPDVCPTTLAEMAALLKALGDSAARVQPLFVSVDPERDTPAVLKGYTGLFDKRILGLTGTPALVRGVADNFKVRYEKVREAGAPPESYTVDHSAGMILLGPDGRFLARFAYAMPIQELTRRVDDYLRASP